MFHGAQSWYAFYDFDLDRESFRPKLRVRQVVWRNAAGQMKQRRFRVTKSNLAAADEWIDDNPPHLLKYRARFGALPPAFARWLYAEANIEDDGREPCHGHYVKAETAGEAAEDDLVLRMQSSAQHFGPLAELRDKMGDTSLEQKDEIESADASKKQDGSHSKDKPGPPPRRRERKRGHLFEM